MIGEDSLQIESYNLGGLNSVAQQLLLFGEENNIWIFEGEMGAGKTTLIKQICKEIGVIDLVNSPTFSIVNEYETEEGQTCYHFDFYRIKSVDEALDIGLEEYFYSGNLCLIEWPSKIESILPENLLEISITNNSDTTRSIKATKK